MELDAWARDWENAADPDAETQAASESAVTAAMSAAIAIPNVGAPSLAAGQSRQTNNRRAASVSCPSHVPAAGSAPLLETPHPLQDPSAACSTELDGLDVSEEFTMDVPTLRFVPNGAKSAIASASEALCSAVLRADAGTVAETRAWK